MKTDRKRKNTSKATPEYQQYQFSAYPTFNKLQSTPDTHSAIDQNIFYVKQDADTVYYPQQRKIIEYEEIQEVVYEPYQKKVIEYQQRTRVEKVPIEKNYIDYYTIEHFTQYIPSVTPQTYVQFVPVERTQNQFQYFANEKKCLRQNKCNFLNTSEFSKSYSKDIDSKSCMVQTHNGSYDRCQKYKSIKYEQLLSYPVYHPDLHKLVEVRRPLRNNFSSSLVNKGYYY